MKNWNVAATFLGEPVDLHVTVEGRYRSNGRIALYLYNEESVWAQLTINSPMTLLEDEERDVVINHDVSNEVVKAVIDSGLFEPEAWYAPVGMATCPVLRLTERGYAWVVENTPQS